MTDLQALLDRIDRLDQQATRGPWESLGPNIESADYTQDDVVSTDVDCSTYCYGGIGRGIQNAKDAEFIALARTLLPQLSAVIRRLKECAQTLTEDNNNASDYASGIHEAVECFEQIITDAMGDDDA